MNHTKCAGTTFTDQGRMTDELKSESLQSLQCENYHLRSENQRLRDLVVSLSAALLRNISLDPPRGRHNASTAERLLQDPDEWRDE
jgi:hypothetical protein